MLSSPSKVIGWECGACTYTNEDATHHDCLACLTRRPVCYAIVAGATAAATARTTRVDRHKQARIAALATAGPVVAREAASSANGVVAGEAPNAAYGPPAVAGSAVVHYGRAPQLRGDHASIVRVARWQQLGLLLPGRWLPPPMGPSPGRRLMLPMGHLLWQVGQ
jgi:hypothetical protein